MQLFNLQIVNGSEYRKTSDTKLTREANIEAARGSIMDRSGNVLVSTEMQFSLEMYKSKTDDEQLNSSILLMTNILEANGNSYIDNFPISIDPFEFHFDTEDELIKWKKTYKIPDAASAEEAFYLFRDKYNINSENIKEIRQILAIRYAISTVGYSTTRSIEISDEISRECAVQLQENSQSLTGVNIVVEPIRVYHTGRLASHIIGYMGRYSDTDKKSFEEEGDTYEYEVDDKVGRYGIEKVFENYLRGQDGIKQIDMSVDGTVTGEYTSQEAIGGSNVALTIDANLQRITEEALERNIMKIRQGGFSETHPAEGGAAVVVNVNTGEILSMASYPNFEPELFYNGISQAKMDEYNAQESLKPLYSRATQGHGPLNVAGAIKNSCNYYFFEVSNRMGIDTLDYWADYFGLGKKTGIELSEDPGILAQRSLVEGNWSAAYTASASIGQSFNDFTPAQMAKYIAMVANGGHPINLSIVKSVINSNGSQVSKEELNEYVSKKLNREIVVTEDKNISEETINAVHEGMRAVAEDAGGTAYTILKDFEIEMGGKTGSAELTNDKNSDEVIAWFAGFAPYDNPEIAIVVMVEKGGHGSYAAEVVRDIMSEYFGMNLEEIREDMSAITEIESFR